MIKLTPEQSHYVLQSLVERSRVRASEVVKALRDREREIRQLRQRLASLVALGGPASRKASSPRKARVRRRSLTPRVRALRRLQGRYMGFVRRLKTAEKARVRALREKKGIGAAIRLASSLGKKK
jgi:hypothetical protein